jgi:hypothetical protein
MVLEGLYRGDCVQTLYRLSSNPSAAQPLLTWTPQGCGLVSRLGIDKKDDGLTENTQDSTGRLAELDFASRGDKIVKLVVASFQAVTEERMEGWKEAWQPCDYCRSCGI